METGSGWNREVSSQERAAAISKLQRFLVSMVGEAPDAVLRTTDLANKFEQHIFTSTTTREEYLRVIVARMQQVQMKRRSVSEDTFSQNGGGVSSLSKGAGGGLPLVNYPTIPTTLGVNSNSSIGNQTSSNFPLNTINNTGTGTGTELSSLELSEGERIAVESKMTRLASSLPAMERLLAHFLTGSNQRLVDPELIRRYAALKALVQKQLHLLPRKVFVLSVTTVTNLIDQIQHYTAQLTKVLGEANNNTTATTTSQPINVVPSTTPRTSKANPAVPPNNLSSEELLLLNWLRGSGAGREASSFSQPAKSLQTMPIWEEQIDTRLVNVPFTLKLLQAEVKALSKASQNSLNPIDIILGWGPGGGGGGGFSLRLNYESNLLGIHLPPEYPSIRTWLKPLSPGPAEKFVRDVHSGELKLAQPISLTSIITLFKYYCEEFKCK